MTAGEFDTRPTPGDVRACDAIAEAGFGVLDVCVAEVAHGTIAACGRAQWATKHGTPLFGWRWQRKANERRAMQMWRRRMRSSAAMRALNEEGECPF